MAFLDQLPCAIDRDDVVLVGASNGTTSVLDYTVAHDASLPTPKALVWMSPGTYTENQHAVADHQALLEGLPLLWLYPTNEPWSQDFAPGGGTWEFIERGEVHGTQMFDGGALETDTLADLIRFVGAL
jgi:hypothetical protein